MTSFRESLLRIVKPRWAQGPKARKFLYALGARIDVLADQIAFGVKARFPSRAPDDALAVIGSDRGIIRGFAEPRDAYIARLRRWIPLRKRKGNPYALLENLQGYLTGFDVKLRVVNNAGAWYTLNADGGTGYVLAGNWDWDGQSDAWARFWVIIYPPSDLWVEEGAWGDGSPWGDGGVWGSTITEDQCADIRRIVDAWRAAHSLCVNIILAFDPASFDPSGGTLPDGSWGNYSKNVAGVQVASRLATARYVQGVPG